MVIKDIDLAISDGAANRGFLKRLGVFVQSPGGGINGRFRRAVSIHEIDIGRDFAPAAERRYVDRLTTGCERSQPRWRIYCVFRKPLCVMTPDRCGRIDEADVTLFDQSVQGAPRLRKSALH